MRGAFRAPVEELIGARRRRGAIARFPNNAAIIFAKARFGVASMAKPFNQASAVMSALVSTSERSAARRRRPLHHDVAGGLKAVDDALGRIMLQTASSCRLH
jgi:hypothetical protein